MSRNNRRFSPLSTRLPGFKGEYLWEFDIAEKQLLALAEAFPAERYGWRPAETARSVSEVLVHLGAGGRLLLALLGVKAEPDLYGKLEGEGMAQIMAMVARNESLEKSMTDKADVIALLRKSLNSMRTAFTETSDSELDGPEVLSGESTTVRRLYMRGVCHLHEHMGQLIAYARAMGLPTPWQGEREARRKAIENELAASKKRKHSYIGVTS
jgi:uncharacterized damage-inducible protein DinB